MILCPTIGTSETTVKLLTRAYIRLVFWPFFRHVGDAKMPNSWVFGLSFEFFSWVLSFFLSFSVEFFCLCFHLLIHSQSYVLNMLINRFKKIKFSVLEKKCRNIEFSSWVLSFFLEFWGFFPWVFLSKAKNQAWARDKEKWSSWVVTLCLFT